MNAVGLLERAIAYALVSLDAVAPPLLSAPTPCAGWDLRTLVDHLNDSVGVLCEGIATGRVSPAGGPDPGEGLVVAFRVRAHELLGAVVAAGWGDAPISVAELPLPAEIVAATGAVEIAVHGWDVAVACGNHRPIPPALASELLGICPLIACGGTRGALFAPPVPVSPAAIPGDRLVAFLGRDPR